MKWFFAAIIALAVTILVGIPFYLGPDDLKDCETMPTEGSTLCSRADAIIAVSGGDTAARAEEAIQLYKDGWAPLLVFSGAAQDTSGPSNALVMKRLALQAGVEESAVVIEEVSRTTAENATNTKGYIESHSLKNVIIVTSAYHQRRASLEFGSKLGDTVQVRNHPVPSDKDWSGSWWKSMRGWWLAGGELTKILVFYAGGGR